MSKGCGQRDSVQLKKLCRSSLIVGVTSLNWLARIEQVNSDRPLHQEINICETLKWRDRLYFSATPPLSLMKIGTLPHRSAIFDTWL
ncbi:hypothetical protein IQ268_28840 [Oculatella sp. LEGE 06141]|uniref:hypothetical protein n=1 Tax=Oculatella sp. LEGE 06141 TaxID=1828648 RepID=UPI00188172D3|nr:hypothetical protein [Oculatella sp. LEGE 06141]MBE9182562.1 hypothetical protein [Oculatella sp. LEGE 06141]